MGTQRAEAAPVTLAALALLAAAGMSGACGDVLLPADFAGPPAGEAEGTVRAGAGDSKDAARPRLALAWLGGYEGEAATRIVAQPIQYQRSAKLQTDWDIGLAAPTASARFDVWSGGAGRVRIGVAKMVYFDDRNGDGELDWACQGAGCDTLKSVSGEFVVYVESPPYCEPTPGATGRPRLAAGYHYFALDPASGAVRQLGTRGAMNFSVVDRAPAEGNPVADLHTFTAALLRAWALGAVSGC